MHKDTRPAGQTIGQILSDKWGKPLWDVKKELDRTVKTHRRFRPHPTNRPALRPAA